MTAVSSVHGSIDMRNPLQEQLLKACLVKKSKVAEVAREQAKQRHGKAPPAPSAGQAARDRRNMFEALVEAVKTHSLGQISHALYDAGGEYRRNM